MSGRRTNPSDGLYVVGVTGGIASGKSTFVTSLAATMPAIVIDADRAGHDVLERPEIARALAGAFGDDVLDAQGKVQRGVLGPRAFSTPERLATLNRIVQEPLTDAIERRMQEQAGQGFTGLLVLDAALLVEWDKGAWCDLVVAGTGLSRAEAERRIAAQLPDGARAAYADLVIENQGTLEEFERACEAAAQAIQGRARAALAARGRVG